MDDKLSKAQRSLRYGEMAEDRDGLYRLAEEKVFDFTAEGDSLATGSGFSFEQAVAAWTRWMTVQGQGHEVMELPRTMRTSGWGQLFSATPTGGGESRLYAVMIGECGGVTG